MKEIILTEDEVRTATAATEVYARVIMGQFNEIIWHTLSMRIDTDNFCERRDQATEHLLKARTYIYPELHGIGHSYGIGYNDEADVAFDIYQVLRNAFGKVREPFSYNRLPELVKGNHEYRLYLETKNLHILSSACKFYYRITNGFFEDIAKICGAEESEGALLYLNLAKNQLITKETHPAEDALKLYEKIQNLE